MRELATATRESFRRYSWPGNVRELRNVIERAMILEDGELITTKYLPRELRTEELRAGNDEPVRLPPEGLSLAEVEASLVRQALERCDGNRTRAARLLGLTRDQLRYRLKKMHAAKTSGARAELVSRASER